jgi:fibronectin type 3 domain-containing protein
MWDAPTTDAAGDELDDLAGYFLYVGTVSPLTRSNSTRIDAGLATSFEVDRLDRLVYYFAVSAVDLAGNESELSEQLAADLTTLVSASVGAIVATAGRLSVALASAVTGAAGSVASLADDAVPPAPENLSATAVSHEQIDLAWSPPAGFPPGQVSEYRVYRDDAQVGTASDTTFQDGGLEPDTEYEYYVTAVDKGDGLEGPASKKVKERTLPPPDVTPPTAPSDLTASPGGPDKIELSWTAADDPESGVAIYNIYRDGSLAGSINNTSYSDTGLDPSTLYSYEVSAVNGEGLEGPKSNSASATTDPDGSPPSQPADLAATAAGPDQIDLTWTAAVDPETGVDSYNVYRDGSLAGSTAATSFSDTGLDPSTLYSYEVSAVNGEGLEGPKSDPASATTDPPPPDDTPPPAPTDLAATAAGPDQVDLTWTAAVDPESGVDSYNIYRDGSLAGSTAATSFSDTGLDPSTLYSYEVSAVSASQINLSWTASWIAVVDPESGVDNYRVYRDRALVGSPSSTFFSDTGLDPATRYTYRVSAVNGDGLEGPRSGEANATTEEETDSTPPPTPSDLTASAVSTSQINLSWTAVDDPDSGVTGYNVYRDGGFVTATASTTFADTGLEPGTTYAYRVSAVNGAGLESDLSAAAEATTEDVPDTIPPSPPTRLRLAP